MPAIVERPFPGVPAHVETSQQYNEQADNEENCSRSGVGKLALDANKLTDPTARTGDSVKEEEDASDDAGQPQYEAGQRVDQLQQHEPLPEGTASGIRRQLERPDDR